MIQKRNLVLTVLSAVLLLANIAAAQAPRDRYVPERIILNVTEQPTSSIAVTWRNPVIMSHSFVEYALSTDGAEFAKLATKLEAKQEQVDIRKRGPVQHASAILGGLKPAARYMYRVGNDSAWSEWNSFTTAAAKAEPFEFVWFGDPQDDITTFVSRSFREACRTSPRAAFWLFSGDMTSEPEDDQLGELFTAAGFIWRMLPSAMAPGNHDMAYKMERGVVVRNAKGQKERTKEVSELWHAHYTLPDNALSGLSETSYSFDYQGVRVIVVNSNDKLEEQASWMEKLLASNPNRWTVVTFHHPLYSGGRERDGKETRNAFLPLFDRYGVDLVLTGHDHTYSRSFGLVNNAIAGPGKRGTVYVLSSCGPKSYVINPLYHPLMAKIGEKLQLFQVIAIDGSKLSFKAFTAAGRLFDSFELAK